MIRWIWGDTGFNNNSGASGDETYLALVLVGSIHWLQTLWLVKLFWEVQFSLVKTVFINLTSVRKLDDVTRVVLSLNWDFLLYKLRMQTMTDVGINRKRQRHSVRLHAQFSWATVKTWFGHLIGQLSLSQCTHAEGEWIYCRIPLQ